MRSEEFNQIVQERVQKSLDVLVKKAGEYADGDDDRLHNFRAAMGLTGKSMRETLGGMMLKHTVSIYDMINTPETDYPQEMWDEKIGDHINYLLLLEAVLEDEKQERVGSRLTDLSAAQRRNMGQKPAEPRPYGGEEPNANLVSWDGRSKRVYAEIENANPTHSFIIFEDGSYARAFTRSVEFDSDSPDREEKGAPAPYGGNKPNAVLRLPYGNPPVPVYAKHTGYRRFDVTLEDGTTRSAQRWEIADIPLTPGNSVTPPDDEAEDNVSNAGMWGSDPNTNKE